MARKLAVAWAVVAALQGSLASRTAAQEDRRVDAASHFYAVHELNQGGRPLYARFFPNGWPTGGDYRRLTLEVSGATAEGLLAGLLASGAGIPLSASDYQDIRREHAAKLGATFADGRALLQQDLTVYKTLAGADLRIPDGFDPVYLPFESARAELTGSFDPRDLRSWRWQQEAAQRRVELEAIGFALLAEASFARDQLGTKRREDQAGREVELYGRSGRDGFFAFIALHAALAQVRELRHRLVLDHSEGQVVRRSTLRDLDPLRYSLPAAWESQVREGRVQHALPADAERLTSQLRGLAALLLGLSELARVCDPEGPAPLKDLFLERRIEGTSGFLFESDSYDVVTEVALFAFRSLRSLHINVVQARAASTGRPEGPGDWISPADLGLTLQALHAFRSLVQPRGRNGGPFGSDLSQEHARAETLITSLGSQFRGWFQDEPGFYDRYSVRDNSRQARTKSLEAQALAIRGLVAAHRSLSPGSDRTPYLEAAEATIRWVDRQFWDEAARAYVERDGQGRRRTSLAGAAALLAALRELALLVGGDEGGRYLLRYFQFLESLRGKGLIREGSPSAPAGLALEVSFSS